MKDIYSKMEKDTQVRILMGQYAVLAEIEECFVANSQHKAYDKIQEKMKFIIRRIQELKETN